MVHQHVNRKVLEVVGNNKLNFNSQSFEAVFNYGLQKLCPLLISIWLLFTKFDLTNWEPYVIIAMILFIDRFSFKVGYSVAYCESRGIDPNDDETDQRNSVS